LQPVVSAAGDAVAADAAARNAVPDAAQAVAGELRAAAAAPQLAAVLAGAEEVRREGAAPRAGPVRAVARPSVAVCLLYRGVRPVQSPTAHFARAKKRLRIASP
jgi:hypothetical protein